MTSGENNLDLRCTTADISFQCFLKSLKQKYLLSQVLECSKMILMALKWSEPGTLLSLNGFRVQVFWETFINLSCDQGRFHFHFLFPPSVRTQNRYFMFIGWKDSHFQRGNIFFFTSQISFLIISLLKQMTPVINVIFLICSSFCKIYHTFVLKYFFNNLYSG